MAEPYFRPLTGGRSPEIGIPQHDKVEAARIAADEEMMLLQSLGRPHVAKPELPRIKTPDLSTDFAAKVARLDDEILQRGVSLNRDVLLSLGKKRFCALIEIDRKARTGSPIGGTDLTRFEIVQQTLNAFEASNIPRRKTSEVVSGAGREREQVKGIHDWADLFKFTGERQEILDNVHEFHDAFVSLTFGQSLLEQLSGDSRLRSHFFCGGKGQRVERFHEWFDVLQGAHVSVKLVAPLLSCLSFLSDEKAEPLSTNCLARAFFNVRSPSRAQERTAEAVCDGFLLGHVSWSLWEYVGRRTRSLIDESRLSSWHRELERHYPAVTDFHVSIRNAFFNDVGFGVESCRMFNAKGYRAFIDKTVQKLLDCSSALLALGIDEVFPNAVVARFEGQVLVESKRKLADKRVQISRQLQAAFEGAAFELEFAEVSA